MVGSVTLNAAIAEFVQKHPVVQALPENSTRIIRMCNDPDCSISALQKIISQDAALAGRLLKAVNSSFYALPTKITRLDRAISYMGMSVIKQVTLSACVGAMCKPTKLGAYDAHNLWDHSIGVAVAARELAAKSRQLDGEEAFLAGILHDIGLLLMVQSEPTLAQPMFATAEYTDAPFSSLEQSVFGFNHCELGEYLATVWKFPTEVATGIRWHHHPDGAPPAERTIAAHLYVADMITAQAQIGCPLTCATQNLGEADLETIGSDTAAAQTLAEKLKILVRLFLN